ncbi:MAG: hypothetical protein IPG78_04250 [Ignavibacteria bacterium]|nr:hypothetical protein [Ignavibacteria bacterium]
MAKNKSNINLHNIEDLKDSFSEFLYNHIFTSNEEIKFINKLLEKDDLLIFGGVIKDFLLAIRESKEFYDIDFKDIDLVATNIQDEIKEFLNDYSIRVNVFGGFKLKLDNKDYDLGDGKYVGF